MCYLFASAMSLLELLVLAVGLAMDATAIAITRGLAATELRVRDAALIGAFFGGAQALMPVIGWLGGEALSTRIGGWGHWITFAVFLVIGGKMIYESLSSSDDDDDDEQPSDPFAIKVLAALAVATSIDALAAGVTLAVRNVNIVLASTVIGVVTGLLSFGGAFAGRRFGARLGTRLDLIGGAVIVGLAVKVLFDHYRAS